MTYSNSQHIPTKFFQSKNHGHNTYWKAQHTQQSQEYLTLGGAEVKNFVTLTLGGAEVGDIVFSYLSEEFPYCDYTKTPRNEV